MRIPIPHYRCPLDRSSSREDPESIKRQGWRDQHILVINADDERLDWMERELVRQIGERLYGKGGKSHD